MNKVLNSLMTAGLCVIATGAFAQVASFDITASPAGTAATTGKFDVKLQQLDGVAGGPGKTFRVRWANGETFPNTPGNPNVTAQIKTIEVTFFSYLGTPGPGTIKIDAITGTAGTTTVVTGPPENPAGNSLWTANKVKFNGSTELANKAQFVGDTNTYLKQAKGFLQGSTGSIVTKYRAYSVKVTLINAAGTKVWSGTQDIASVNAPEGSSLALLATGLIPMGMLMRRKASKKA